MRFFVTTSKRAHSVTDTFAKQLSFFLPHAVFENRGRKTIDKVWLRTTQLGKNAVAIINERNDVPCEIQFLIFSEMGWQYGQKLVFDDFKFPQEKLKFQEVVGKIEKFDFFGEEEGEIVNTVENNDWTCWERESKQICFKNLRWEK